MLKVRFHNVCKFSKRLFWPTQSIIGQLPRFRIILEGPGGERLAGRGADILDGPRQALG